VKMSKSLGNVINLDEVMSLGIRPVELRYYLAAPHYRSRIDYSEPSLREASVAYQRIEGFVTRAVERVGAVPPSAMPAEFAAAMDDDLNTSRGLAYVHERMRDGNAALAGGDDAGVMAALGDLRAMLGILGVDPVDVHWSGAGAVDNLRTTVDDLVSLALEQRSAARTRKDWAAADAIREQLNKAGIVVEDTPTGPRWTVGTGEGA